MRILQLLLLGLLSIVALLSITGSSPRDPLVPVMPDRIRSGGNGSVAGVIGEDGITHVSQPQIGFFGIDSATSRDAIPFPKEKAKKPPYARSEFLSGMSSAQYLRLIEQDVASGHPEVKNVLLYYWGENPNVQLAQGQGRSVSGSNLATWSTPQLAELRTLGLTPLIGMESLDPNDVGSMVARLQRAGYSGQKVIVRLCAEPQGSNYTNTPAEYRRRFEDASALMKSLGKQSDIIIEVVFTVCGTADFQYAPDRNSYENIGIDLFVTPENLSDDIILIRQVATLFPDKALVIPEFGIATAGHRANAPADRADAAWGDAAAKTILGSLQENFPGRIKSMTPYDINAKARITERVWSWVWTPDMYRQLVAYASQKPYGADPRPVLADDELPWPAARHKGTTHKEPS